MILQRLDRRHGEDNASSLGDDDTVASSVRLAKNESLLIACALDNPKAKDKGTSMGTFYLVSAVVIPADAIPASATTHLEFAR